jgi:hypothetical protein
MRNSIPSKYSRHDFDRLRPGELQVLRQCRIGAQQAEGLREDPAATEQRGAFSTATAKASETANARESERANAHAVI